MLAVLAFVTVALLQARIEASNPGERLKKDMYVTAEVRAGNVQNALLVPDAALLRDSENMPYVYIQTANNQFARRMVTVGDSGDGKTQILTGLTPGDKIVTPPSTTTPLAVTARLVRLSATISTTPPSTAVQTQLPPGA